MLVGGYPIKSWWGVPHPVMVGGELPIQSWWGVSGVPPHTPSRPGQGTPHHPDLAGVPPPSRPGWHNPLPSRPGWGTPQPSRPGQGTPPPSRPGWGTPPTIQTWMGYPPKMVDKVKTLPSVILRMRVVITEGIISRIYHI